MESKHTDGEWFVSGREIMSMPLQVKIGKAVPVTDYEETVANARLMAAAPKLLEGCETAIGILKTMGFHSKSGMVGAFLSGIEEAIKLATK